MQTDFPGSNSTFDQLETAINQLEHLATELRELSSESVIKTKNVSSQAILKKASPLTLIKSGPIRSTIAIIRSFSSVRTTDEIAPPMPPMFLGFRTLTSRYFEQVVRKIPALSQRGF